MKTLNYGQKVHSVYSAKVTTFDAINTFDANTSKLHICDIGDGTDIGTDTGTTSHTDTDTGLTENTPDTLGAITSTEPNTSVCRVLLKIQFESFPRKTRVGMALRIKSYI
jgi:hypothetical protein